jgi:hypothetical protein
MPFHAFDSRGFGPMANGFRRWTQLRIRANSADIMTDCSAWLARRCGFFAARASSAGLASVRMRGFEIQVMKSLVVYESIVR